MSTGKQHGRYTPVPPPALAAPCSHTRFPVFKMSPCDVPGRVSKMLLDLFARSLSSQATPKHGRDECANVMLVASKRPKEAALTNRHLALVPALIWLLKQERQLLAGEFHTLPLPNINLTIKNRRHTNSTAIYQKLPRSTRPSLPVCPAPHPKQKRGGDDEVLLWHRHSHHANISSE